MKIVILTYGRNLGINHDVLYLDCVSNPDFQDIVEKIKSFGTDLIIEQEFNDSKAIYSEVYKQLPSIPKVWWCIDAHINFIEHINYAKQFDYVFCAQSWFVPLFENQGKASVFWLPLCHTQPLEEFEKIILDQPKRDIEISFIGNVRSFHIDRKRHLINLKEEFGDKFQMGIASYENTLKILQQSKISFNCSLNNDLNFRVWESLAMGTNIFTDMVTDINKIYNLPITWYNKNLYSVLSYIPSQLILLPSTDLQNFIRSKHTLTHRYNQMLEMVATEVQYEY